MTDDVRVTAGKDFQDVPFDWSVETGNHRASLIALAARRVVGFEELTCYVQE